MAAGRHTLLRVANLIPSPCFKRQSLLAALEPQYVAILAVRGHSAVANRLPDISASSGSMQMLKAAVSFMGPCDVSLTRGLHSKINAQRKLLETQLSSSLARSAVQTNPVQAKIASSLSVCSRSSFMTQAIAENAKSTTSSLQRITEEVIRRSQAPNLIARLSTNSKPPTPKVTLKGSRCL